MKAFRLNSTCGASKEKKNDSIMILCFIFYVCESSYTCMYHSGYYKYSYIIKKGNIIGIQIGIISYHESYYLLL